METPKTIATRNTEQKHTRGLEGEIFALIKTGPGKTL